jgi:hypothetical protein
MKADLELITAHRNLLSFDQAIAQLHDKFGDRVDGNADFIDAEERRFEALECLGTIGAGSPDGMIDRQGEGRKDGFCRRRYWSQGRDRGVARRRRSPILQSGSLKRPGRGAAVACWPRTLSATIATGRVRPCSHCRLGCSAYRPQRGSFRMAHRTAL